MYNGVINIYKEAGYTSHDVVAKMRGMLRQKKIGHTGTLDPQAVGVLPVCLGSATKLCDMLSDKSKTYRAVMKLGIATDTQDIYGKVIVDNTNMLIPDDDTIEKTIMSFVGEYAQIPPMYSALKVNGKKLYELAREGIEIERKPRNVTINNIKIHDISGDEVTFTVDCSKGTYIRTLCNDIGDKLMISACMKSLCRTRVSVFEDKDAITLDELQNIIDEGNINDYVVPVDKIFDELCMIKTTSYTDRFINNGNKFSIKDIDKKYVMDYSDGQHLRVYDSKGIFKAVYSYDMRTATFCPVKMFLG